MKRKLSHIVDGCLVILIFAAIPGAPAGAAPDSGASTQASSPSTTPAAAATVTCDFSNPGYSGWCRVTKKLRPGKRPRALCSQVLACLNDARCIQTYCNATTIRGGWKLEKVEAAPKTP